MARLPGTKFVLDAALTAILEKLQSMDLDSSEVRTSRWSVNHAVQSDMSGLTPQGINVSMSDGLSFEWTVAEPERGNAGTRQLTPHSLHVALRVR